MPNTHLAPGVRVKENRSHCTAFSLRLANKRYLPHNPLEEGFASFSPCPEQWDLPLGDLLPLVPGRPVPAASGASEETGRPGNSQDQ